VKPRLLGALLWTTGSFTLAAQPAILDIDILNPTMEPDPVVAPGSVFILKGSGLATNTRAALAPPLPVEMAGVRVLANSQTPCPLLLVSPDMIVAHVPFGMPADLPRLDIQVKTPDGDASMAAQFARTHPILVLDSQEIGRTVVTIPVQ
jgi:uncharacterized protein (TIGR03437 family)